MSGHLFLTSLNSISDFGSIILQVPMQAHEPSASGPLWASFHGNPLVLSQALSFITVFMLLEHTFFFATYGCLLTCLGNRISYKALGRAKTSASLHSAVS